MYACMHACMYACMYIAIYKQKGYHNHKSTRKNNDTRDQRFDLHLLNLEPRFDLLTAASVATSWHFPSCGPIIHHLWFSALYTWISTNKNRMDMDGQAKRGDHLWQLTTDSKLQLQTLCEGLGATITMPWLPWPSTLVAMHLAANERRPVSTWFVSLRPSSLPAWNWPKWVNWPMA